jgi:hypothetical protein
VYLRFETLERFGQRMDIKYAMQREYTLDGKRKTDNDSLVEQGFASIA